MFNNEHTVSDHQTHFFRNYALRDTTRLIDLPATNCPFIHVCGYFPLRNPTMTASTRLYLGHYIVEPILHQYHRQQQEIPVRDDDLSPNILPSSANPRHQGAGTDASPRQSLSRTSSRHDRSLSYGSMEMQTLTPTHVSSAHLREKQTIISSTNSSFSNVYNYSSTLYNTRSQPIQY